MPQERSRNRGRLGAELKLKSMEFLINRNGDISIGRIGQIRCAATAADQEQQLAALVRRPNESLVDLLQRLDAAIGKALEDSEFIDEING